MLALSPKCSTLARRFFGPFRLERELTASVEIGPSIASPIYCSFTAHELKPWQKKALKKHFAQTGARLTPPLLRQDLDPKSPSDTVILLEPSWVSVLEFNLGPWV